MTKYFGYLGLITLVTVFAFGQSAKIPAEIPKCRNGDSDCILKTTSLILNQFSKGIPSMNLLSLDPISVDEIDIVNGGQSPVNVQLNFKNAKLHGVEGTTIDRVSGFPLDPNGSENVLEVTVPRLELISPYTIRGQVLILPIQGQGISNMTLLNVKITIKFTGKAIEKNGKVYMQTDNLKLIMKPNPLIMNFENLFNGDKALGPSTNQFLNENWSDIYRELEGSITSAFGKVIQTLINNVFASIPYKSAFLS